MRSVISLLLAATFSFAAHAGVYHPRVLSWGELTHLPKTKRIAYLHEMQKVLVTLEKMQKRNHVAYNSGDFDRMRAQVASLLQMSAILPEAKADQTFEIEELEAVPPQEEVQVLKPVIKKKKKQKTLALPKSEKLEEVPPQEVQVLKPVIKKKTDAAAKEAESAADSADGYLGVGAGLSGALPAKKKAPTKAGYIDAGENMGKFHLPSKTKESKPEVTKTSETRVPVTPVDDGRILDPEKPAAMSGASDPQKPASSIRAADPEKPGANLPAPDKTAPAGNGKFVVIPTTPFNPEGKCGEGMTWNANSKTCVNADYYDKDKNLCAPQSDSCAQLNEKEADEARLRLAHTPSAGICTEGGFFSAYKNPQNPKEGCDITKGLNGLEKKLCASGEKPCNMALFCLAAPFDDVMKDRFAQAGLPFERINKNALGKFEGDDGFSVPRSICVKGGGNVTAMCVSEYNRLLAGQGKGEMPINVGGVSKAVNLDGIKYKACDVLTFHSEAYDKLAIADTWRAVQKAVDGKYNDTCGNADFRALYCDDCRAIKAQLFAAAKAAVADPCAAAGASGETPAARPSGVTK